jgi:septin family protein
MSELGDKITIQGIDRQTGKLDKAGDLFRVMYIAPNGMRHTLFCNTMPELLVVIENIIKDRMKSCKTSKPTELPITSTQKIPAISS